jgi:hypothetical protein
MVSVLAMFNISKAKDEFGKEIDINDEYSTFGMLTYVSLFIVFLSDKIRTYITNPIVIRNLSNAYLRPDLPLLEN